MSQRRRGQGGRVVTPTRLQIEAVECGAAALGIVLAYHGLHVPAAELRRECGVSRDGSKASNVVKAARRYGFVAKGHKKEIERLADFDCPYIVFWNFNHFLVVEGFRGKTVYLNDPATGPRTVTAEEFDACYTGVVLTFEPGPEFKPRGSPPSAWAGLWRRARGHRDGFVAAFVAGLFLAVTGIAAPAFTQIFVDELLIEGRQGWLTPFLIGMGVLAVLEGLGTGVQLLALRRLAVRLKVGMSGGFLWQLLHLPMGYYAQRFAGEIATRQSLNDSVAGFLTGPLGRITTGLVTMIFFAAVMFSYDPTLTAVALAFALVNFLFLRVVARRRSDDNLRLMTELGKTGGLTVAGLQSIETLKASAQEGEFYQAWVGQYTKALDVQQSLARTNAGLGVLPSLLSNLATAMVLVFGGFRVMDGALSIGMLIAFQSYVNSFSKPVGDLVQIGSGIQEMKGNLQRLDDVMENPADPAALETPSTRALADGAPVRLAGEVELRDVEFGYSPIDPPVLHGISFHARPGQRIAIVGASGSGKSTLLRLVAGFYEPWSGSILFDGYPTKDVPRLIRSQSIAVVEQDLFLFGGSVQDNLALWDDTVPFEQLERACEDAEVHDVVQSLAGAYAAELQEAAGNLSGGQRQRLELARALVSNPSVLILDEPTSWLDTETESRVMRNLRRRGCTMILFAHRLSTIRDADEILVLSAGEVRQRGTHDQLIQDAEGEYAKLLSSEARDLEGASA